MSSPKSDTVISWISNGIVRVHFDATYPDAIVPKHLRGQNNVALDWGFHLPLPIVDMKIDRDSIRGTLSFAGYGWAFCEAPWGAVFCVLSQSMNRVRVWLNDAPAEVQREVLRVAGEEANKKLGRQHLRLIKGGD